MTESHTILRHSFISQISDNSVNCKRKLVGKKYMWAIFKMSVYLLSLLNVTLLLHLCPFYYDVM